VTGFHGFVDESIRAGCYRLTIVRVASRDLGAATRAVRLPIPKGQLRVHLSDESDQRRRAILNGFARLDLLAVVFETPYDRKSDDQPARDRCMRELVASLPDLGVGVVVLDSRGPDRDKKDRSLIRSALRNSGQDRVGYSHRGSRDEPLLALPDAFGWAAGAGRPWLRIIEPVALIRPIPEVG